MQPADSNIDAQHAARRQGVSRRSLPAAVECGILPPADAFPWSFRAPFGRGKHDTTHIPTRLKVVMSIHAC